MVAINEKAAADGIEAAEAIEAVITLGIQALAKERGGEHTSSFLKYEMSSVGSGGVVDVARR